MYVLRIQVKVRILLNQGTFHIVTLMSAQLQVFT